MTTTVHYNRRSHERHIPPLCLAIIKLFGRRLDKRDGMQLDMDTYKELVTICNNTIKSFNKTKKGGGLCIIVATTHIAKFHHVQNRQRFF
jgi:hypothetical protein